MTRTIATKKRNPKSLRKWSKSLKLQSSCLVRKSKKSSRMRSLSVFSKKWMSSKLSPSKQLPSLSPQLKSKLMLKNKLQTEKRRRRKLPKKLPKQRKKWKHQRYQHLPLLKSKRHLQKLHARLLLQKHSRSARPLKMSVAKDLIFQQLHKQPPIVIKKEKN